VTTGDYQGDLTDELEEFGSGSFIDQFVSGGPKTMRFRQFPPRPVNVQQNVKCIILKYEKFKL